MVDDGRIVRSNIIASQVPEHERFGGVVPEIASRQHVLAIDGVVARALAEAAATPEDLDAVAVTRGPGLSGPLLVGTSFAKGFSLSTGLPLLAVDHIEAHILSVWLSADDFPKEPPELPLVALVASGGHTQLVLVEKPGSYRALGRTLDDAAGEAFDKVGRILGLPYPGGPHLEFAARTATGAGVRLPRAWLPDTHDFSFSGLKTAMSREVKRRNRSANGGEAQLSVDETAELAYEFQASVADVLARKLADAVSATGARSAALVGGVANNAFIRETAGRALSVTFHVPAEGLSSDNAAMIAGAAFWNPHPVDVSFDVSPSLELAV